MVTGVKLSQIASGGAVAPATDVLVAVRSGTTDVLVTPPAWADAPSGTVIWDGTRLTSSYIPTDVAYVDAANTFTAAQVLTASGGFNFTSAGLGINVNSPPLSFIATGSTGSNQGTFSIYSGGMREPSMRVGADPSFSNTYINIRTYGPSDGGEIDVWVDGNNCAQFTASGLSGLGFLGLNAYSYDTIGGEYFLVIANSQYLAGFQSQNPNAGMQDSIYVSHNPYDGSVSHGLGIPWLLQDSTTSNVLAAHIFGYWVNSTHATYAGGFEIQAVDYNGARTGINIQSNGSAALLGLYGATPVVQPSAISAPSGGSTVDTQARAAIASILDAIGAAAGGIGITA